MRETSSYLAAARKRRLYPPPMRSFGAASRVLPHVQLALMMGQTEHHAVQRAKIRSTRRNMYASDFAVDATVLLNHEVGLKAPARVARAAVHMLSGVFVLSEDPETRKMAALVAALAVGMAGGQVHVICLSDTLARDDSASVKPIAEKLGLTSAVVMDGDDLDTRGRAYGADLVFASVGRLARDHLRERVLLGRQDTNGPRAAVARLARRCDTETSLGMKLDVAIVMDADLALLEAPLPVGLATDAETDTGREAADQAFVILSSLCPGQHYVIDPTTSRVRLLPAGQARVQTFVTLFAGQWTDPAWREKTLFAAITVRDLFQPQKEYIVKDGSVSMQRAVGRTVEGPAIPDLIAAKEALPPRKGELHFSDTRRLIRKYGTVGAIGLPSAGIKAEVSKYYGLSCRQSRGAAGRQIKTIFMHGRAAIAADIAAFSDAEEIVFWAPVETDLDVLPPTISKTMSRVGAALFSALPNCRQIIQIGAAPKNWERRLAEATRHLRVTRYLSPEDGLFASLDVLDDDLTVFRESLDQASYERVQAAHALIIHRRRMAQFASDTYFDRILGFTGDIS